MTLRTENMKKLCKGAKNLGYTIALANQIHIIGYVKGEDGESGDRLREVARFELYEEQRVRDFVREKSKSLWETWQEKFKILDQPASALGWQVTCGDFGPCLANTNSNSIIKYFPCSIEGIEEMAEYISTTYLNYVDPFGETNATPIANNETTTS